MKACVNIHEHRLHAFIKEAENISLSLDRCCFLVSHKDTGTAPSVWNLKERGAHPGSIGEKKHSKRLSTSEQAPHLEY